MKKNITIKDLDEWGACHRSEGERYSDENLKSMTNGKRSLTVFEVLELDIPDEDKLWLVLRKELIPGKTLFELGHIFAKRVVRKHCIKCGIVKVETWAKGYLKSKPDFKDKNAWAEMAARAESAARAAWAAASAAESAASAAESAARAAESAARAAESAAWAAAWAAASAAARAASAAESAASAAKAAENKWQVKQVKKVLM